MIFTDNTRVLSLFKKFIFSHSKNWTNLWALKNSQIKVVDKRATSKASRILHDWERDYSIWLFTYRWTGLRLFALFFRSFQNINCWAVWRTFLTFSFTCSYVSDFLFVWLSFSPWLTPEVCTPFGLKMSTKNFSQMVNLTCTLAVKQHSVEPIRIILGNFPFRNPPINIWPKLGIYRRMMNFWRKINHLRRKSVLRYREVPWWLGPKYDLCNSAWRRYSALLMRTSNQGQIDSISWLIVYFSTWRVMDIISIDNIHIIICNIYNIIYYICSILRIKQQPLYWPLQC